MTQNLHHIVIVGGGAGGLELATQLGETFGKTHKAKITLIDQNLTHIWKPLLHEIAAGSLNPHEEQNSRCLTCNSPLQVRLSKTARQPRR